MHPDRAIADSLAAAFLAGPLDVDGMVQRGGRLLGKRWPGMRSLARRVQLAFAKSTPPRRIALTTFVLADRGFEHACENDEFGALTIVNRLFLPQSAASTATISRWSIAKIGTPGDLAQWLGLTLGELDWFADLKGLERKQGSVRLRHYHYRPLAKRYGAVRLIEAPKPRLKALQRRILKEILDHVPPHVAACGFRRGRSVKDFAGAHVNQSVVLKLDLRDFFPTIAAARIQALFRTIGYGEPVADLLAGICTNSAPDDAWNTVDAARDATLLAARFRYTKAHLPQGAPTSPALANLCTYRLDCRLSALANTVGAAYTRYADDLAFSGGACFARVIKRFQLHVCATVIEEGFIVHHHKTRIMRQGTRQQLAGMVVNKHLNLRRADFDRLKATLTNCIRKGPAGQNLENAIDFRAHLLGRISFVEMVNLDRGRRLRALFEHIDW